MGELVGLICRYDRPPFARATITARREVTAGELTEADARADGFRSLAALVAELDQMTTEPAGLFPQSWVILTFDLQA